MSRSVLVVSLVACLGASAMGCEGRPTAGLYNNSGRIIIANVAQAGTPIVHRGLFGPGAFKVGAPWPAPVGETATVSWQEGNDRFDRDVAVRSVVPGSFDGTVWFKIEPDRTVQVVPVSQAAANRGENGPDRWKREGGAKR